MSQSYLLLLDFPMGIFKGLHSFSHIVYTSKKSLQSLMIKGVWFISRHVQLINTAPLFGVIWHCTNYLNLPVPRFQSVE